MALEFIERQPFKFTASNEYQGCKRDEDHCIFIQDGDDVFIQFKQTTCGSQLICDPTFIQGETDLAVNGDFDGSGAGWTFAGPEWTYNAGGYMDYNSAGPVVNLEQVVGAGIVAGGCYTVEFTISNRTAGGVTPWVGGAAGFVTNLNGTYSQKIIAGATNVFAFIPSGAGQFSIDGIRLFYTGPCWCPDNGYVTIEDSKMCHTPGAATVVTQIGGGPATTSPAFYKVSIEITGRTAGKVNIRLGTAATESIDFVGNGTFTDYIVADTANAFSIHFDSDFDGCITNVNLYPVLTNHVFSIVDLDNNLVVTTSGFSQYVDNYIILWMPSTSLGLDYSCYKMAATDACTGITYYSNCFSFLPFHAGTREIIALDRDANSPDSRYSFGLLWYGTLFKLVQRLDINFRRPTYQTTSVTDRYSTGEHFRSYAEKSKQWEMAVGGLDEIQHDCLDIQTTCMDWSVDGVKYFRHDEEYVPLWDEGGYNVTADVKLSVSRKTEVLFGDNCNR